MNPNTLFKSLFLLVLFLDTTARGAEDGKNILKNPSFESDGNDDKRPDFWFVYPDTRASAVDPEISIVQEGSIDGARHIKISKSGGAGLALTQNITEENLSALFVGDGRAVLVKGKARGIDLSPKGAAIVVQVFYRDANGDRKFAGRYRSEKIEGSTEWVPLEVRVNLADSIPADSQFSDMDVNLEIESDFGSAEFDELSLTSE